MSLVRTGGAERVLAAQGAALPQPDQMCGPFAARAALHAVLEDGVVPSMLDIAAAAGTRGWPRDLPQARPPGVPAPGTRLHEQLPLAASPESSGTDAAGLAAGLIAVTGGRVAVVPVRQARPGRWSDGALLTLLDDVAGAPYPVGLVANVATAPLDVPRQEGDPVWDVGHFVVVWGVDHDARQVAIADSYVELTAPGQPPGCRLVTADAMADALGAPPGRGLLMVTDPEHAALLGERAVGLGMVLETWRT